MFISNVFNDFLQDQKGRLRRRIYRQYDNVMDMFSVYLDKYGTTHIDGYYADIAKGDVRFVDGIHIKEINSDHYSEFFEFFLIQDLYVGKSEIRQSVVVMRKFTNWLASQGYTKNEQGEDLLSYFADGDDESVLKRLWVTCLFYELSLNSPTYDNEQLLLGSFMLKEVYPGELWMANLYKESELIGPVIVTEEISELLERHWVFSTTLCKYNNCWYVTRGVLVELYTDTYQVG